MKGKIEVSKKLIAALRQDIVDIQAERREVHGQMREAGSDNTKWQALVDRDYELKQSIHQIRSRINKLFKESREHFYGSH